MATITTLISTDTGSTSRGVINTNFANLNTDKIETSVLDTDGTLAANSDAKVATQKAVKTYVDTNAAQVSFELTNGATHSLTTVAGQSVLVIARASVRVNSSTLEGSVLLKYNGVTKKSIAWDMSTSGGSPLFPATLMYTETPGAATANVTVECAEYSLEDVQITVIKLS